MLKDWEIILLIFVDVGEEDDEFSGLDVIDDVVGILGFVIEDGDVDCISWEREVLYG